MLKEIFKKYLLKRYRLIVLIFGVVLFSSLSFIFVHFYYLDKQTNSLPKQEIVINNIEEPTDNEEKEEYYYVDIKGAITNPNVYKVLKGSRIADVVKIAGGLTKQADTSVLNLSKIISDEMFIIIYTKEELKAYKDKNETKEKIIEYIEKECNCPDPNLNDACVDTDTNEIISDRVNINTATKGELMTLPNIGESKAQDIIDYRLNNGLFINVEDIKNVTGIGDSIFDKIKDFITL